VSTFVFEDDEYGGPVDPLASGDEGLWWDGDGNEGLFGLDEEPNPLEVFTLDPESSPGEPLVEDLWNHVSTKPFAGYEVTLQNDPDGYWGGIPRQWTITVESRDLRYAPSALLRTVVDGLVEWARGETFGVVDERIRKQIVPQLRKRDRIVCQSDDGERRVVYEQPTLPGLRLAPPPPPGPGFRSGPKPPLPGRR
jgi:hypothetical protein